MHRPNNAYNMAKYKIFLLLESGQKFYSPIEIASACNLSLSCVKSELTKLSKWHYIWRSTNQGKGRHKYIYQSLKPKAVRTLSEWKRRKEIEKVTGIEVSLNRKKKIPDDVMALYKMLKEEEVEAT